MHTRDNSSGVVVLRADDRDQTVARHLDLALLVALLALAGAVLATVVMRTFEEGWDAPAGWWLAVPVIVVVGAFPLFLDGFGSWLVVGLEPCVLVYLALTLPPHIALALWCVGVCVEQFVPTRSRFVAFNAATLIVSGAALVFVIDRLGGVDRVDSQLFLVAAAAITVHFILETGVSTLSLYLDTGWRGPLPRRLVEMGVAYVVVLAVGLTGCLAVVVSRETRSQDAALLLPPLALALLALRALTRDRETARRLGALMGAGRSLHRSADETEILDAMSRAISTLAKSPDSGLREWPPSSREVGRPVRVTSQPLWAVMGDQRSAAPSSVSDTQALAIIVQQGQEALERIQMTRELRHNANRDPLTSLWNRAVFLQRVSDLLESLHRRPGACAMLFCDLDGFKQVNDQFGHEVGDAVLVEVSRRLTVAAPSNVLLARLGGDEFAALVPDADTDAWQLASTLRATVATPIVAGGTTVAIRMCVGIAVSAGSESAEQLLRNSDIAMYNAKQSGRDQVVWYRPSMGVARVRALGAVDKLRQAIENRELRVVYQPIVSAADGEVQSIEALARWTVDGEAIPPDKFIAIAERANLIEALGERVLEQVCGDLTVLDQVLAAPVSIAVNISARQLGSKEFVDSVVRAGTMLGHHPLKLEITETELIRDEVIESSVMTDLLEQGMSFCVDDFGMGFSSLSYLAMLPVQSFKIDRTFSEVIDRDRRAARLLGSMLSMSSALGMEVVVEGIERSSQVDVIRALSADGEFSRLLLQGYLLGEPMPADALVEWARGGGASSMLQ